MPLVVNDVAEVITIMTIFPQLAVLSYPLKPIIVSLPRIMLHFGLASSDRAIGCRQKVPFEACRPIALL
jgi:hypothetical protein